MTKQLDRVSKLLAKAENAGTPEEAATFLAKAQELASVNNIDLAVARLHQAQKERVQEPEERRLQVNPYNRRQNRKHFAELAMAVCDVNDVKYLISGNEFALFCVGFPSDLDVVTALFTHLSVQMVVECDEALKRGEHRDIRPVLLTERVEIPWEDRAWTDWNGRQYYDDNPDDDVYVAREPEADYDERLAKATEAARAEYLEAVRTGERIYSSWARSEEGGGMGGYRRPVPPPSHEERPVLDADGNRQYVEKEVSIVDGRVFRHEFYAAFVARMRGRLWEARRAAERDRGEAEETTGETALALRDKAAEVDRAHDEQRAKVVHLGTYKHALDTDRLRDHSGKGTRSGSKAAETVPVGDTGRGVNR